MTKPATTRKPRTTRETRTAADGWASLLTGQGINGRDKTLSYGFNNRAQLDYGQLSSLYRQNWLAKRIVDDLVSDATRAGFEFECSDDPDLPAKVHEAWERAGIDATLADGLRWALVFRGSVGLLLTDDVVLSADAGLAQPLEPTAFKSVKRILIVDARYAVPDVTTLDPDPSSPNFGLPVIYTVTPFGVSTTTGTFAVHWTRLLRFDGAPTDIETRIANQTWGDSLLEVSFDSLRRYGMAFEGTAILCAEFAQGVLAMQNLDQLLASGQEAAVLNRVASLKMSLSVFGVGLVDAEKESYTRTNTPVSGLDKLLDLLKQDVAGAFHRPQSGIWGNATGTLAGAEEDHKTWAEFVHGWQKQSVIPQLKRYTDLLLSSKDGPTKGKPAPQWKIKPNPIDAPDLDKEIERRERQAKIDQIYFQADALEANEIRNSRFGGASYSHETTLDPKVSAQKAKAAAETETETETEPEDDDGTKETEGAEGTKGTAAV